MDLRLPSGLLFVMLGVLLLLAGIFSRARASLTEMNLNLWCGFLMLALGLVLLLLSRKRA